MVRLRFVCLQEMNTVMLKPLRRLHDRVLIPFLPDSVAASTRSSRFSICCQPASQKTLSRGISVEMRFHASTCQSPFRPNDYSARLRNVSQPVPVGAIANNNLISILSTFVVSSLVSFL